MPFFALLNLPGLKVQKLLTFRIFPYSLYKIPTVCQISVCLFPAHVPPPFDKIFNGLSCTSGCPLTCSINYFAADPPNKIPLVIKKFTGPDRIMQLVEVFFGLVVYFFRMVYKSIQIY